MDAHKGIHFLLSISFCSMGNLTTRFLQVQ